MKSTTVHKGTLYMRYVKIVFGFCRPQISCPIWKLAVISTTVSQTPLAIAEICWSRNCIIFWTFIESSDRAKWCKYPSHTAVALTAKKRGYLDFSDCWWKGWLVMCVSSLVMASSPASFQRPAGVTKMAFWQMLLCNTPPTDSTSVSDPDPDWIKIQSDQWIRIRIQEGSNDPQK